MKITSRFKTLLAGKEIRERKTITLRDVSRETGVSIYTITGFANNTLKEIPVDALMALCKYLECTTGDLLEYEELRKPTQVTAVEEIAA
jgi:DNA-binding Xre family transcriptional regulator